MKKKIILFVILEKYADWEGAYLSSALSMLGQGVYESKTVSMTKEAVSSIGGFHALPDYDIYSVPDDYEALILIGGMSWRTEAAQQVKPLVEKCFEAGRVLGGICDASAFLGTTGVLNQVKHTSNDLEDMKAWAGEVYTGEEYYRREQAVADGNIVTANGTAALEFAREVLLALKAAPEEKIMEWYSFHKLGLCSAAMPEDATSWDVEAAGK
ncbi:type 1 glutamine amidotransferase family protein [Clostridium sp. AN503]|uniref:type 1 glutamine amidotransferase family protein n=1 Tax=Clostridium sp. AN503 TaxID=3160598 RepID=UPI003457BBC5